MSWLAEGEQLDLHVKLQDALTKGRAPTLYPRCCMIWGLPCTWMVPWYKFMPPIPNSPPTWSITCPHQWSKESPPFKQALPDTGCLHTRALTSLGAAVAPTPVQHVTPGLWYLPTAVTVAGEDRTNWREVQSLSEEFSLIYLTISEPAGVLQSSFAQVQPPSRWEILGLHSH